MGDTPATEDATIVKKLRDGGAVIIGITNMHELGIGTTGNNPNRYLNVYATLSSSTLSEYFGSKTEIAPEVE